MFYTHLKVFLTFKTNAYYLKILINFFFYFLLILFLTLCFENNLIFLNYYGVHIIWIAFFILALLNYNILQEDIEDGSLYRIKNNKKILYFFIFNKILTLWLILFPLTLSFLPIYFFIFKINFTIIIIPILIILTFLICLSTIIIAFFSVFSNVYSISLSFMIVFPLYLSNYIFSIKIINFYLNHQNLILYDMFNILPLLLLFIIECAIIYIFCYISTKIEIN